jgi:predicted DNA-binding antitoxin AbrB/MazE fold protein
MRPVEALYENGLLRPAKPLNLRPGEHVGVIVVRQADPSRWDLARLAATSTDDAELADAGLEVWAADDWADDEHARSGHVVGTPRETSSTICQHLLKTICNAS